MVVASRCTVAPSHRRISHVALACFSALFVASCGGLTTLSPTAPSSALSSSITAAAPAVPAPAPNPGPVPVPASRTVSGVIGSVGSGAAPCWADRYPCQTYDFTLSQAGAIDVTVTWNGEPRALKVQLYWAGEGLAHEDIAPRTGPSRISFRRPMMEAANYRLRVVSLEPDHSIPFSLTVNY
jgi:hypothetical protein